MTPRDTTAIMPAAPLTPRPRAREQLLLGRALSPVRTKNTPMIDSSVPSAPMTMGATTALSWTSGAVARVGGRAEGRGREDHANVGLVEVGAHAGDVAHVVADVVGDGRGVARVVLGDASLDLADQVGADVGRLGEDAAANASEERLDGRAHAERQHRGGDDDHVVSVV